MENPFKNQINLNIEYKKDAENQPGLPVDKKFYKLPKNLLPTEYSLAAGKEIYEQNLTGNIISVLRIQNNQTEILSYICKILFEEISNNRLSEILKAIQANKEILLEKPEDKITILESKLEQMIKEFEKINKQIEELNKKL